eukprot:gnl/MRDRNA2_/MRDRNA2_152681_c0_seq1.p1 gnl/MRDRNA2_/MRDRNA2_152681_c0~~gnl/MRDRNA2_/MRDRNA2_152681_c0_seq1.p1  ORF type:complete len:239 (-),score=51.89 gnl/MRDRNA2_/MRDRNA2_152681_c0_seq1:3-623(-)
MIGQDELDRFKAEQAALQKDASSSKPANADGYVCNRMANPPPNNGELLSKDELPAKVQEALKRLSPAHVSEVCAAVGQPGGSFCMQYESDSTFAANFASVLNCAVMLRREEPRSAAMLFSFDWQDSAEVLDPPEEFIEGLWTNARRFAGKGEMESNTMQALFQEMERLPKLWLHEDSALLPGPCAALPGLDRLRQAIRAVAILAAK